MSRITPTIGRKLWYYPCKSVDGASCNMDDNQPFDATVICVWPASGNTQLVNLFVVDHVGGTSARISVPLIQEDDPVPSIGGYAKWMPYQIGQASAQANPSLMQSSAANVSPSLPAAQIVEVMAESPIAFAFTPAENGSDQQPSNEVQEQIEKNFKSISFSEALVALKAGRAVTRRPWRESGVFVYYVPEAAYPAQTGIAKQFFGKDAKVPYLAYLAIKRADDQVCVFIPGMDSILAEDWIAF
jgi:hypothetical protein